MKKITLVFFTFLAFQYGNAQNTCETALVAAAGTTSVGTIDGTAPTPICAANGVVPVGGAGEWYMYTATVSGLANVTSNLPANAGGDTRLHIYTGACGALTCLAGNDDISGSNFLSNVTFGVTSGTTYYIAWDNRWEANAFDFTLTETFVDCSTTSPYSYNFSSINTFIACYDIENTNADATTWGYNNGNDFNGDAVNDPVGIIFPSAANVLKNDWLFLPVFNGIANAEYSITVVYNAFNNPAPAASESFDIVALNSASSTATSQTVLGTYSNITQSGMLATLLPQAYSSTVSYTPTVDGDFYFGIHATTPAANSGILILFSLSVNETLGIDEFSSNSFTHFYNKDVDVLTLKSSDVAFNSVALYNILGQEVMNKQLSKTNETLNLSELKDGIYLAKVQIGNQIQTVKFLKQ